MMNQERLIQPTNYTTELVDDINFLKINSALEYFH